MSVSAPLTLPLAYVLDLMLGVSENEMMMTSPQLIEFLKVLSPCHGLSLAAVHLYVCPVVPS